MPILDDICTAKTKGIAAKDVAQTGKYPVFGATGLVGYLDTFEVENEYVGIIKDGAGVGRTNIYPAKSSLLGTMQYILPKENTDIKYLMYLLRSLNLGCSSAGAAITHIYFKNYKKNIVPNFDLNKQRCISKLLEKIANGLSVMDKSAEIQRDKKGEIIYDKESKDTEIVKWEEDIKTYMEREVLPHIPDAKWFWEENLTAKKPVIKTGAEIPFTRYFYKYQQPVPSEELERKFLSLEQSVTERIKKLFE